MCSQWHKSPAVRLVGRLLLTGRAGCAASASGKPARAPFTLTASGGHVRQGSAGPQGPQGPQGAPRAPRHHGSSRADGSRGPSRGAGQRRHSDPQAILNSVTRPGHRLEELETSIWHTTSALRPEDHRRVAPPGR
jgi:hypothetical protein